MREFVKTSVILTPGALLVGCEPQSVLHFRGIAVIRWGAQKLIFEQKNRYLRDRQFRNVKKPVDFASFLDAFFIFAIKIGTCAPAGRETTEKHIVFGCFL